MASIDFAASESHWVEHLAPVASEAFAQGHEVRFYVKQGLEGFVPGELAPITTNPGLATPDTPITVCSSWVDARNAAIRDRRVVLMEHGAGQSYSDRNPSYVGGKGRERLVGVLVPNEQAAARHRRFYANGPPVSVVGSPRVDYLCREYGEHVTGKPPVLVCSWHWHCKALPETESAFEVFGRGILRELLALEQAGMIRLYGHAHPRYGRPREMCSELGIPFIFDFEEVCDLADVYMVDNSSTLFEFAALDRPVIVVNSPRYRRQARHGLRFWEYAGIGPNVWNVHDVPRIVEAALSDDFRDVRRQSVEEIYPFPSLAAEVAVDKIIEWSQG